MNANMLKIENLHLQIPGLTPQQAHHVGYEVAQQLARRLPARVTPLHLARLDLRLTIPAGTPQGRIVDLVVDAIVERIG
jgi:hypothetical protein